MESLKKFNRYVKGTLSENDTESFTKEIVQEHFEKEKLKKKWNKILEQEHHSDHNRSGKPSSNQGNIKRLLFSGLAVAASVLLLLFAWSTMQDQTQTKYEQLLAQQLDVPHEQNIIRKGAIDDLEMEAANFYVKKEYGKAATIFEKLVQADKEKADWTFYLGLCHLYQNQADPAIEYFDQVLNIPNTNYSMEPHWYLGLAYTMQENFIAAEEHLSIVAFESKNSWKVKEAKSLLKAFEEIE